VASHTESPDADDVANETDGGHSVEQQVQADSEPSDIDSESASSDMPADEPSVEPVVSMEPLSHKEIIQLAEKSVVYLVARDAVGDEIGSGTGFLVDGEGLVATNYHVIASAVKMVAQSRGGESCDVSEVVAYDADYDVALVRLSSVPEGLSSMPLELPRALEQGDEVTAIGHPSGFKFTVTDGIVSAVRETKELPEEFQASLQSPEDATWIQTSAAISGGNSGGPLMNQFGRVVGVNTWIAEGQNLGFAIHVRHVIDLINAPRETPVSLPLPGLGTITDPVVGALRDDFSQEYAVFQEALYAAQTEAEQAKVLEEQQPVLDYAQKFIELSDKLQGSGRIQALVQACSLLKRSSDPKHLKQLAEIAVKLRKEFLHDPWIAEASLALGGVALAEVVELQQSIFRENASREAKGVACFALATNVNALNAYRRSLLLAAEGDAQPEYIALLSRAADEFGDVRVRGQRLKKVVEPLLKESAFLPGMPAPEIEGVDFDGVPMKLSEHRGKVVVLDFWADWCPYCRQMYPENKKLVEKYAGQPFVLLGVNCDAGKRGATAVRSQAMTWRSFVDGDDGSINEAWGITGFPTLFVIDQRGRITHQLSSTTFEALDEIVQSLLSSGANQWEGNLLARRSSWKYYDHEQAPAANWMEPNFDDASWPDGIAPLGFGDDQATELRHAPIGNPQTLTYYFRHKFTAPEQMDIVSDAVFSAYFDDGMVAYLNGQELVRRAVPLESTHETPATEARFEQGHRGLWYPIPLDMLREGENVLAVEVHQASEWSADVRFDAAISTNVVGQLRSLLDHEDRAIRVASMKVAGSLGETAKPLIPVLQEHFTKEDAAYQWEVFRALLGVTQGADTDVKPPATFNFGELSARRQVASLITNRTWQTLRHEGRSSLDYEAAWLEVVMANRIWPKSGESLAMEGLALHRLGKHREALMRLVEAKEIHGKHGTDYLIASMIYDALGRTDKSQQLRSEGEELLSAERKSGKDVAEIDRWLLKTNQQP
jgi:S1-C subfamily serine protease/thiol-disulfide isomerase/thioredoxin